MGSGHRCGPNTGSPPVPGLALTLLSTVTYLYWIPWGITRYCCSELISIKLDTTFLQKALVSPNSPGPSGWASSTYPHRPSTARFHILSLPGASPRGFTLRSTFGARWLKSVQWAELQTNGKRLLTREKHIPVCVGTTHQYQQRYQHQVKITEAAQLTRHQKLRRRTTVWPQACAKRNDWRKKSTTHAQSLSSRPKRRWRIGEPLNCVLRTHALPLSFPPQQPPHPAQFRGFEGPPRAFQSASARLFFPPSLLHMTPAPSSPPNPSPQLLRSQSCPPFSSCSTSPVSSLNGVQLPRGRRLVLSDRILWLSPCKKLAPGISITPSSIDHQGVPRGEPSDRCPRPSPFKRPEGGATA